MTIVVTDTADIQLNQALYERFCPNIDGWWYPLGAHISFSLVRIKVEGGIYTIQRRSDPSNEWILLVKALVSDFDSLTFNKWADEWTLSA